METAIQNETEAQAQPEKPAPLKPVNIPTLAPNRFKTAQSVRKCWAINAESTVKKDNLLSPVFWSAIAVSLSQWDHIEVRADDGTFYAELIVLACDRTWAKVAILNYSTFGKTAEIEIAPEFIVKHLGAQMKWCIIRVNDNAITQEGMQSRDEANLRLKEYLETIG